MRAFTMLLIGLVLWTPSLLRAADNPYDKIGQLLITAPLKGAPEARRAFAQIKAKRDPAQVAAFADMLHRFTQKSLNAFYADPGQWPLGNNDYFVSRDPVYPELTWQMLSLCRDLGLWQAYSTAGWDLCFQSTVNGDFRVRSECYYLKQFGDTLARAGQVDLARVCYERIEWEEQQTPGGYTPWLATRIEAYRDSVGTTLAPLVLAALEPTTDNAVKQTRWQRVIDALQDDTPSSLHDSSNAVYLLIGDAGQSFSSTWVPKLEHIVVASPSWAVLRGLQLRCVEMWAGQDDAYRQCLYNQLKTPDTLQLTGFDYHAQFVQKLRLYGRAREADAYQRRLEQIAISIPSERLPSSVQKLITPKTPAPLRHLWLNAWCAAFGTWDDQITRTYLSTPGTSIKALAVRCPPAQLKAVAQEFGESWVANAPRAKEPWRRTFMLRVALELFEYGGATQEAADARAQIAALESNDPAQALATAVGQAYWDRIAGHNAEAITRLLPFYTPKPPPASTTSIDGMFHLAFAYNALHRDAEFVAMEQQIEQTLDTDTIPAVNATYYYSELAYYTPDLQLKARRLDRARTLARKAGLEALATRLDEQISLLALNDASTEAQFAALITLTQQREAQREQLALDPALRQQWFANNLGPYRKLLKMAAVKYHVALYAFSLAEYMRARSLLDELAWQKVDMGAYLPPDLQAQLTALRHERQETLGLYSSKEPVDGATLKAKLAALAKREAELTTALREQVPAYQFASTVATIKPEELIARIQQEPTRAVVEYTLVDDGFVVVAFHGTREPQVAFIPINPETLWEQIGRFRESIWKRDPQVEQEASDLYRMLVKPIEGMLAGAQRVIVIGDGALQLLPFSALRDDTGAYLAEKMPVLTAPSVSLLFTPRATPRVVPDNAVIFAAPNTGAMMNAGDDPRGLYVPIRGMLMPERGAAGTQGIRVPDLQLMASIPLPGAEGEGRAIAKLLAKPTLVTGAAATKLQLYTLGQHAAYVHIATHGFADPDMPTLSGLLLAGTEGQPFDILTAQEVFTWTLPAKLVTLSACQTAMGQDVAGEGVIGLTRAFLCAGAENVVSTLWPVGDASTAQLMTAFYTDVAAGKPIEVALNAAQQRLLKNPATRAPYYWAGFTLVRGTWQ